MSGNGRNGRGSKAGRTKWDDEPDIQETILAVVADGGTYVEAVEAAGIGRSTLNEWKATRPDILDTLLHARKAGRARRLALINLHAAGDWRAAAWLLAVENPARYSIKQRVEHSTPERPMGEGLEDEQAREALDKLGAALDAKSPEPQPSGSRLPSE